MNDTSNITVETEKLKELGDVIESWGKTEAKRIKPLVCFLAEWIRQYSDSTDTDKMLETDNEKELARYGLLGAGIYNTFHSLEDAIDQMQWHIKELEEELEHIRPELTEEQLRRIYPVPDEWCVDSVEELEMTNTTDGATEEVSHCLKCGKACDSCSINGLCPTCVSDLISSLRHEIKRLCTERSRDDSIHTLIACVRCGRGVRLRNTVFGMCPSCAEREIWQLEQIERAVTDVFGVHTSRKDAIKFWRDWEVAHPTVSAGVGFAIADALEVRNSGHR